MVDKQLLLELKEKFELGPSEAQVEDTIKVFEFFKQVAAENDEIRETLEEADNIVQLYLFDKDMWFWLKSINGVINYGEGKVENPSFTFKTNLDKAAGVIFGEIDPTGAYMAGEITIEGNLQDALAFNDLIIDAIEVFEELTDELEA